MLAVFDGNSRAGGLFPDGANEFPLLVGFGQAEVVAAEPGGRTPFVLPSRASGSGRPDSRRESIGIAPGERSEPGETEFLPN